MNEFDPELVGGLFRFPARVFSPGQKRHMHGGDMVSRPECEDGGDGGIDSAAERHQDAGSLRNPPERGIGSVLRHGFTPARRRVRPP